MPRSDASTDTSHMAHALRLAERALGQVWPNPAVGCVILDREGRVAAAGHTQRGGRPHAETESLREAGIRAQGGTAYVSLEPCAHIGKTGPCAQALIEAGVARVVSAVEDPDPRVAGKGHGQLRAAGVALTTGVLEGQARALNAGFFKRVKHGLPLLTLKLATSLDGKMALANGQSQWITGEEARSHGHWLRATHDAVLTGIGTVVSDDPRLDCRLPGLAARSPHVIILDTGLRCPEGAAVFRSASARTVSVFTKPGADRDKRAGLEQLGAKVFETPPDSKRGLDLEAVLRTLAGHGLTRVLAEAGPALTGALWQSGYCDRVAWFRAPLALGADAASAIAPLGLTDLKKAQAWHSAGLRHLGPDVMESYERTD